MIKAAAGGTITLGDLTLDIPPGALADDTEITIRKVDPADLPDEFSDIDGDSAYELTPDGLEFSVPVTATLKLAGKPVQDDGSLVTGLPPLMITSENGDLELLDDLTINVDADTNRSEATGFLGHFSTVLIKHPIRIINGEKVEVELITITISGVPDSHPVEENNPFQATVKVSKNGEIGSNLQASYTSMPDSPVSGEYSQLELGIYDKPNLYSYDCIEAGSGTYRSEVDLSEVTPEFVVGFFRDLYGVPPEAFSPAELGASFKKRVVCTEPGGEPGGENTTFPDLSLDVVGNFDFQNVTCNLNYFSFSDPTYHIEIQNSTITISQGSTKDVAVGGIHVDGSFTATQTGGNGELIELYDGGHCSADPFSCTANYTYVTNAPGSNDPCEAFYIADFEPIF